MSASSSKGAHGSLVPCRNHIVSSRHWSFPPQDLHKMLKGALPRSEIATSTYCSSRRRRRRSPASTTTSSPHPHRPLPLQLRRHAQLRVMLIRGRGGHPVRGRTWADEIREIAVARSATRPRAGGRLLLSFLQVTHLLNGSNSPPLLAAGARRAAGSRTPSRQCRLALRRYAAAVREAPGRRVSADGTTIRAG